MARTVRDARIESPTARLKLAVRHEPYWRTIDEGMHLGYRKGKRKGSWLASALTQTEDSQKAPNVRFS